MSAEALDSKALARQLLTDVVGLLALTGKLRPEEVVGAIKGSVDEWAIAPAGARIVIDFARRPVDVDRPAEIVSARSLLERLLVILEHGASRALEDTTIAWLIKSEVSRWDIVLPSDAAFSELRRRA